jgi:UTP pyrophosphatase
MQTLKYLAGYSDETLMRVHDLITANKLGEHLRNKYPDVHDTRTDRALYDYTMALKQRYMRSAVPLSKVAFDNRLRVLQHALGTHTTVSRVQGGNLKAKREIRVASLFKDVPPEFLKMIVVHELAHMKEREHDKAFYQLCTHMEPDYHQYEFDLRLLLTQREVEGQPEG